MNGFFAVDKPTKAWLMIKMMPHAAWEMYYRKGWRDTYTVKTDQMILSYGGSRYCASIWSRPATHQQRNG